jgi:hypothetical protein
MNKPLPFSKTLMGRAFAGEQHPIYSPEKQNLAVVFCTKQPAISALNFFSSNKFSNIQCYQGFQRVGNKIFRPNVDQMSTKKGGVGHE